VHVAPPVGALLRHRPAGEAGVELVAGCLEDHDSGDPSVHLGEEPIERFGLRHRPRETVEQDARGRRDTPQAVADEIDGHVVRHVRALVKVGLHATPELGLATDVIAEDLPGRKLDPAALLRERLRLRALPHPGRTHDDEVPSGAAEAGSVRCGHALGH